MFFKKYKQQLKLFLFGVEHSVDFIIEAEENSALNKEKIEEQCNFLTDRSNEIAAKLTEYVESNYYDIINEFYASVDPKTISKKETADFSLIMNDLKNNTMDAKDVILKNIKAVYFSIVSDERSYLFVYLNNVDEYGVDIIFDSEITVHVHDGEI